MTGLTENLKKSLTLKNSELIGCSRRNRLMSDTNIQDGSWRYIRGNALCGMVGYKIRVRTPADEFDVFYAADRTEQGNVIVTFRGGPWRDWWTKDLTLLGALCKLYLSDFGENIAGVLVLNEVEGELREVYIPVPGLEETERLVQQALDQWRDYQRISKSDQRGRVTCPHCPVKRQCDAMDIEGANINDWPDNYQVG